MLANCSFQSSVIPISQCHVTMYVILRMKSSGWFLSCLKKYIYILTTSVIWCWIMDWRNMNEGWLRGPGKEYYVLPFLGLFSRPSSPILLASVLFYLSSFFRLDHLFLFYHSPTGNVLIGLTESQHLLIVIINDMMSLKNCLEKPERYFYKWGVCDGMED